MSMPSPTLVPGGSPPDADVPRPAPAPVAWDRSPYSSGLLRRVLVVEPSEAERARLARELAAGGLEVHACADLAAAEELATMAQPGLIFARWDLPSGGGLGLLRRLAERATTGWMPVILHGEGATAEGRVEALELGALDVLETTPAPGELLARLRAGLRLRERMDDLERRAYRDTLTGLINRGALEDHLARQWDASRRHGTSLSVLMVDLDRLKEINDTHGHPAGDEALSRAAAVLSRSVRGSDVVARYGGDEFVIVAPACPPGSALRIADRFRAGIADPLAPGVPLTLSVGIAGTDGATPINPGELLCRADQALYLAKRSGRDAVALYDPARGGPRLVE